MWLAVQIIFYPLIFQIVPILFQMDYQKRDLIQSEVEEESEQSQNVELSQVDKHTIELLRQLMGDDLQLDFEKCDDFLARWLRECDMDLTCASERLKRTLRWRRSDLQEIVRPNRTFLTSKEDPSLVQGRTNDGGSIMIITSSGFDLRKLILNGRKDELLKNQVLLVERYFQASIRRTENEKISLIPGIVITNVYGFTLKQHACSGCIRFYQEFARICNTYYPGITKFSVTINGPTIARPILLLLKSLLDRTMGRFMFFGSDMKEWKSFLLKYITQENLLEEFGGSIIRKLY